MIYIIKLYKQPAMKKILKILDVTDNDTSDMSYVLKDHIGSLCATVTDGEVEYYSFDAWGRET